jgi:single-strand DNA-binding protein
VLIASIYGRLGADPVERTTKAGNSMVTVSVAVDVAGKDAEPATLWVSILAFGNVAEALLRAEQGQMLAAMGKLTRGEYTNKAGEVREQWTMLAESVVTAKSARPSGPRRARQE